MASEICRAYERRHRDAAFRLATAVPFTSTWRGALQDLAAVEADLRALEAAGIRRENQSADDPVWLKG